MLFGAHAAPGRGRREDELPGGVAAGMIAEGALHEIESRSHDGEVAAEVGEHVGVLRSFAREKERHLSRRRRVVRRTNQRRFEEVDPSPILDPNAPGVRQLLQRVVELAGEIRQVRRHDRQPHGQFGKPFVHGVGDVPERRFGGTREEGGKPPPVRYQLWAGGAVQEHELRVEAALKARGEILVRATVLLEDGVGVDPAEAERVHTGPPGRIAAVDPGSCLGVQIERGLFDFKPRVRRFTERGREHLVV